MNLRKRTLAFLLTVCLLLSVVVPMASAASLSKNEDITFNAGTQNTSWELLCDSSGEQNTAKFSADTKKLKLRFVEADVGSWVAVRVKLDIAATQKGLTGILLCTNGSADYGGYGDAYILPDTTATGDALKTYIDNNLANAYHIGQTNSSSTAWVKPTELYDLQDDSLILVVKCTGPVSGHYQTWISKLRLFLKQSVDSAEDLKTALTNLGANRGCITLNQDINGDATITIPENVTVNLNGHTLTGVTNNGTLINSSQGGSTPTPPAGGEGGGTVTPPAGGEGGGTDTPAQTGDTSPVAIAVVALAASLLAMVALIPGKKNL